ncbi:MAG: hypothetical protein ACKV19_29115 [Verrucomicrobiales bacterium]
MKIIAGRCSRHQLAGSAVAGLALALERMPSLRKAVAWTAAACLGWLAWQLIKSVRSAKPARVPDPTATLPTTSPYPRGQTPPPLLP